ncbi:MAG: AmmeMemoRadiSam system protein B [Thermoplasmata archaeon]|nr:AmmeMemoRadiSam system protein B [Thermoplasmata archaeon]NIS12104.1 AmmeMemoRadiSam system protein B [Thermoplasmata archaeon]NIS20028.1 AmmeMemoRadiSam system protein B [Thermoplasmata archaeon]NIT77225.1 AmmeMemoRadiSam system protein B [Thermoplasmata archaeon]NIU49134.1 AmmeMemoRadiSam system protein B [Thermoplasmata archaeon]
MRNPVVAGRFYEGREEALRRQIEDCYRHSLGPGTLPEASMEPQGSPAGWVVPHAGYLYSGPVAAFAFADLARRGVPGTVVVYGTQHYSTGSVAISYEDHLTPLGPCRVDQELAQAVTMGPIEHHEYVHDREHSLEVQLPFLQHLAPETRILPIAVGRISPGRAAEVGKVVREAMGDRPFAVLASTDFTHNDFMHTATREDREWLRSRDQMAIDRILERDTKGLHEVVTDNRITMCGMPPVMAMLETVQGSSAELLKYACSAQVAPSSYVVGYAAIRVD